MKKIITLILAIGFAISNDLIIIGDNTVSEMANILMGIQYLTYSTYYEIISYISTSSPIKYEGYNIHFSSILAKSQDYGLFGSYTKSYFYENLHRQLQTAKEGTNVLIYLCAKNMDIDWVGYFGEIADKYFNLNFYFVSTLGVIPKYSIIKNSRVRDINEDREDKIETIEFDNFFFKSILYNENPTTIVLDGLPVDMTIYFSDEFSFFRTGLKKLFKAMVEGLE